MTPHDQSYREIPTELTQRYLARFWAKVDKTPGHGPQGECWIWTAATMPRGYGIFGLHPYYSSFLAHRISWFIAHGLLPRDALILHTCDNPPCVRPNHLFQGTQLDNVQDCLKKGRFGCNGLRGETIPWHKLSEKDVLEIRGAYAIDPEIYKDIADRYKITIQAVWKIIHRKSWRHI
jgi:hypothetical protein